MITLTQLILSFVIVTLTFMVVVAGIQVFHILHEFRLLAKKLNKILANTEQLSDTAARPVTAVNTFFAEVKELVNETQDTIIDDVQDKVITPSHSSRTEKIKQRFFKRSGLPLRPS